jgi:hypothetical protein
VSGKIHYKFIINISMFGVDNICTIRLRKIQIKIKCNQTSGSDKFTSNLLSGTSCISSRCICYEQTISRIHCSIIRSTKENFPFSKPPYGLWGQRRLLFREKNGLLPRGHSGRGMKVTSHVHLLPK